MNESQGNDRLLTSALRAVAEDDETLQASAGIEARLLTEAAAIARARRRGHLRAYAVAAMLTLAVAAAVWLASQAPREDLTARSDARPATVPPLETTEFFPLFYSSVPASDVQIVRLEVSRAALATFGLEAGDSGPNIAATVLADVIVGEDGLARAIRFVHPLTSEFPEELRP